MIMLGFLLGLMVLVCICIERSGTVWLPSIRSERIRAVLTTTVNVLPPIAVFSFLTQILSGFVEIDKEPWWLIPPLSIGLLLIYFQERDEGTTFVMRGLRSWKDKIQGDLEALSLKVDGLEARISVIEGRLQTLSETSPLNEGAGSMAGRPVAADKASRSQGETVMRGLRSWKDKTQGDLEALSLKVDGLEARISVIEGRLQTLSETSPLNEGAGSMAGRPVAADKASTSKGETNSGDTHEQAGGPPPSVVYSITERGMRLVEFRQPKGRRGGGSLHVKMIRVMYDFYRSKGWYPVVDEGDEREQKPDLEVWEPKTNIIRLEDGSLEVEPDPYEWAEKPFHVEVETTPRKSKAQVIKNYVKARRLGRYVVFAVPSENDLQDLRRILREIGASEGTYEIDDISDLLSECDEVRRQAGGDEE